MRVSLLGVERPAFSRHVLNFTRYWPPRTLTCTPKSSSSSVCIHSHSTLDCFSNVSKFLFLLFLVGFFNARFNKLRLSQKRVKTDEWRLFEEDKIVFDFYHAMLCRAQYCHTCDVEVSWSHRLEYFKNNFVVD